LRFIFETPPISKRLKVDGLNLLGFTLVLSVLYHSSFTTYLRDSHMRMTFRIFPCLIFLLTAACGEVSTTPSESALDDTSDSDTNPCNPGDLEKPPIWEALADLDCGDENTRVQAAADVTVGSMGEMTADLLPIETPFTEVEGMCAVNAHWHLGAEHRNTGTYDIPGADWIAENDPEAPPEEEDIEPGNFCPDYDAGDPMFTTEYAFEHCSENMRVGYTYEVHWPHSNLGMCDTEWQYQSHFMNGVLCKANEADMLPTDAVESVFENQATRIGVQAQVFTIVNDPAYDYPDWNPLDGWNTALAMDVAIYQGSTTGQQNGNETCRGTGGMVTWQVDRGCHFISASAFDNLCRLMLEQRVDMTEDTHPHNARETTDAAITTDIPM
jgi:hypothetical protein